MWTAPWAGSVTAVIVSGASSGLVASSRTGMVIDEPVTAVVVALFAVGGWSVTAKVPASRNGAPRDADEGARLRRP